MHEVTPSATAGIRQRAEHNAQPRGTMQKGEPSSNPLADRRVVRWYCLKGSASVPARRCLMVGSLALYNRPRGGVMIAASYWSLLAPSIEMAEAQGMTPWLPPLIGFLFGGIFLRSVDAILPHLHLGKPLAEAEGLPTRWRRSILLVTAITLHNIPEGLAVGVAFGAAALSMETGPLASAVALAIGIGLQNFPEGIAVAMPLRREGMSRWIAFLYGQASGAVEPIAGVLGAALVLLIQPLLPYALAFAAGAMIYVVVEETIPESHAAGNTDLATLGLMLGFAVMMTLDVALG